MERWIQLYFAADYYGLFGKEKQGSLERLSRSTCRLLMPLTVKDCDRDPKIKAFCPYIRGLHYSCTKTPKKVSSKLAEEHPETFCSVSEMLRRWCYPRAFHGAVREAPRLV